jgi:TolB-like protein
MILWADHAAATGEDFTTILGLGTIKTIEKVASKVIEKLLDSFSSSPPEKEKESTIKIGVMPFQNKTKTRDVGMIVTNMFIVELFKSKKFEPLEYGEVRRLIVDRRVKDKGEIDYMNIEAISGDVGVDAVIVGTVELYQESQGNAPPEVTISIRLIDARNKKIRWSDTMHCTGGDDVLILDWGRVRSAENVVSKTVWKLVQKMDRIKWQ